MNSLGYQIGVKVLEIYLNIACFTGNQKAKKAKIGRRNWKNHLELFKKKKKTYWIHAASHGEAIMALPIIEKILNEKNNQVTMSFFSASGFENFNYKSSRFFKFYLPIDKKNNYKKLIEFLNPKLLIFIKYDLWLNLISDCHDRNIPTFWFLQNLEKNNGILRNSGKS